MAGPPTRTQVEFLLPRRTPERAQADRPHDITGSLLCPQHSSSTGRRAPTRAPRAQGTGSGQRVPGKVSVIWDMCPRGRRGRVGTVGTSCLPRVAGPLFVVLWQ